MFYANEYDGMSEVEYLAEYEFRTDPNRWKEHYPTDEGYVPYVFSIDQGFKMRDELVECLNLSLTDYERGKIQYLLRAVERDIRNIKISEDNERQQASSRGKLSKK